MEPKTRTLQERFGFNDPELTTPKHDAIMLWLDENVEKLLNAGQFGHTIGWTEACVRENRQIAKAAYDNTVAEVRAHNQHVDDLSRYWNPAVPRKRKQLPPAWEGLISDPPPFPSIQVVRKTWEAPVYRGGSHDRYNPPYVVGFVDLLVEYSKPYLDVGPLARPYTHQDAHGNWKTVLSDNQIPDWIIGYNDSDDSRLAFEVKPTIRSLGEVIRQIRLYQAHMPQARYVIVSPDTRFEGQLRAQGIEFLRSPA